MPYRPTYPVGGVRNATAWDAFDAAVKMGSEEDFPEILR